VSHFGNPCDCNCVCLYVGFEQVQVAGVERIRSSKISTLNSVLMPLILNCADYCMLEFLTWNCKNGCAYRLS